MGETKPNYIDFLLSQYIPVDKYLKKIKNSLGVDIDTYKIAVNMIFDSDMLVYIDKVVDYKLEPYDEILSDVSVMELMDSLYKYKSGIIDPALRYIAQTHFSPIWRISAIIVDYTLRLHVEYANV